LFPDCGKEFGILFFQVVIDSVHDFSVFYSGTCCPLDLEEIQPTAGFNDKLDLPGAVVTIKPEEGVLLY